MCPLSTPASCQNPQHTLGDDQETSGCLEPGLALVTYLSSSMIGNGIHFQ